MRHAHSLSPEWAYRASSFPRTIGIVLVALAVGAAAGSAVVFSFVDRPSDQSAVAARSLAAPFEAAPTLSAETPKASPDLRLAVQSEPARDSAIDGQVESGLAGAPSAPSIRSAASGRSKTAALAEAGAAPDDGSARAGAAPSSVAEKLAAVAPADKKATKKHHVATRYAWRAGSLGLLPGAYHMNVWGRY